MAEEKGVYNSSEISELIKALCKAKKGFKPITKDGKNPFLNTKYVTLDAIINATKDALSDNGLVIMHHHEYENDRTYLVTELIHESGQMKPTKTCMDEYLTVSLNDKGNAKVTPIQIFGAVMAYLRRYHIGGLLDIAIDDDVDGKKQGDDKGKDKPKSTLETLTAKYFKFASGNEAERHKWQVDNIGKAITKDWTEDDFQKAIDILEKQTTQHKPTALEALKSNLDTIKTLKELNDKWVKNKKAYEANENKESILELFATRKRQLTLELLSTSTGFSVPQLDEYVQQAGDIATLLTEATAGNVEAITQLKNDVSAYLESQKQVETKEASQEEIERELAFEGRENE
jgi:hypothetical protein